ncbi:conserved hypothetical protein [Rhodococcus sp. RD6.2]|jgi:hypothetical protein|uniref:hypothetical protein n=1 Tax=Rhodococcus sp. RD6.2 TaxID=260936 RepID=UPI00063B7E78|nr:hypothetical protein [Rhodococcus sp. RD6.2]CRK52158.1 conserved hypothetical protein [Rhodococcus sp. RD6.2]
MAASPPIQQVNLYLPPYIQAGIAAGLMKQTGGTVRNLQGQIVKLLEEASLAEKAPANAQRAAAAILRDKRVVTVLVVTTTIVGGATVLAVRDRRQAKRCVAELNASLIAYLEAARDARLDEVTIGRLLADLDAAEAHSKHGNVAVAATLVELVMEYTSKLAEANSVELEDLDTPSAGEATVVDFRRHLEAQRRIFRRAA